MEPDPKLVETIVDELRRLRSRRASNHSIAQELLMLPRLAAALRLGETMSAAFAYAHHDGNDRVTEALAAYRATLETEP